MYVMLRINKSVKAWPKQQICLGQEQWVSHNTIIIFTKYMRVGPGDDEKGMRIQKK